MMRIAILFGLLGAGIAGHAALAAPAGYCLAQCNAHCYGNSTPSCVASCSNRCMFSAPNGGGAPTTLWGAIAAGHPPDGSIGWSKQYASEQAARSRALSECRTQDTGKCDLLLSFAAPYCGAAATAWNGDDSLGTYAHTATNRKTAEQLAMNACQLGQPGAKCELEPAHCPTD